ncbi:MAG: ATP-binding cassette domain-containing protein, partial [Bacteroidetes bacterium]
ILIDFTVAAVQLLFGLILLSLYHPFFIFYDVLMIGFLYLIYRYFAKKGLERNLEVSKFKYKMVFWLQELGRVYLGFKYAVNSNLNLVNTDKISKNYIEAREKYFNTLLVQYAFFLMFNILAVLGLLAVGGYLVVYQKMNLGQFVAAEIIIILLLNAVEKIIFTLESAYDLFTSLEKVSDVVDIEIDSNTGVTLPPDEPLGIVCHKMYFKYTNADDYQLKNINLEILPKTKVGIYGRKNSGKTTFVNIVSGLLEPTMGDIKYNDYSVKELNPESLHSVIGYASADNYLFEGSIIENITMGRANITIDDVNRVVKGLNLEDFVEANKKGLNTMIYPTLNYLPSDITI